MSDLCRKLESHLRLGDMSLKGELREHVNTCPRCRALLANFQDFLAPEEPPADARAEVASANLEQYIAEELLGGNRASWVYEGGTAHRGAANRWWSTSIFRHRPIWVAVGIAAALVLAVGLRAFLEHQGPGPGELLLRSEAGAERMVPIKLSIVPLAPGECLLNWEAIPAAESYGVCFYGEDLSERLRLDVGDSTSCRIVPQRLRELTGQDQLWWAVATYRHGHEMGVSRLKPLTIP